MKKVRPPFVHSDQLREPDVALPLKASTWTRQQLQAFDWKSAASLRAPVKGEPKAAREWDSTEWGELPTVSDEAKRIAEQLNEVATRIRNGEIAVDGRAPTPETAMAAALEALIKAR